MPVSLIPIAIMAVLMGIFGTWLKLTERGDKTK